MRAALPRLALAAGGVLLPAILASVPSVAAETLYIEAGLVLPIDGEPIENGRIVVENGKVTAVGADVERPPFSRRIDASDQVVTPGFVVPTTRIGLPTPPPSRTRPGQTSVDVDPGTLGADEFFAPAPEYARLLADGITAVGLLPPMQAPGIAGQVSLVSTLAKPGDASVLEKDAALVVDVMAHGPWREKVGKAFDDAVEKVEKEREKEEREKKRGKKDPRGNRGRRGGQEDPLMRSVKGDSPVLLRPRTPAGWVAALDELPTKELDLVLLDGAPLYDLVEELAEHDVRIVTWPALVRLPRTRIPLNRAAEYEAAEIPYAFMLPSDDVTGAAQLRDSAIEMARTGASREKVLAALTLEAAKALGVDDQVGSIAKGRRADLVFWTGHPLDPTASLARVMVAGEWVDLPASRTRAAGSGGGA